MENYHVFLSYAREDLKSAKKIYDALTNHGIKVWFDDSKLEVGTPWKKEIKQVLGATKFVIVLLSCNSLQKQGFFQEEIRETIRLHKEKKLSILPVRLDDCKSFTPKMLDIKNLHWVDLFPNWEEGFIKIIRKLMLPTELQENLEIIGFDLGHGETSIAKTMLSASSEPQIIDIEGKTSIITAVAMSDGKTLIGDDAYLQKDVGKLSILFKSPNLTQKDVSEPIFNFVRKCLEILKEEKKIVGDKNTYYFVGSPSGWDKNDINMYEKVLRNAGMINVNIIPESRAAFLDAKESGDLNESFETLVDNVLVIDIGSSTTDFTIVNSYRQMPLDFGNNKLGAGLIEQMIFEKILSSLKEENQKQLQNNFDNHPELKAKCLLKCREVKEKYFSKSDEDYWKEKPVQDSLKIDKSLYFEIEIYKKDMEYILNKEILKLNNLSWKAAFRDELLNCQQSKYCNSPKLILMTGGGSRMAFTRSICQEIFPEAEVRTGLEPSLTIAKGLARVGRANFKLKAFQEEVENFLDSEDLSNLIQAAFPELWEMVADGIYSQFSEILIKNVQKWLEGDIKTLKSMELEVRKECSNLLNENKIIYFLEEDINPWLKELGAKIEKMTYDICHTYKIPPTTFNLSVGKKNLNSIDFSVFTEANSILQSGVSVALVGNGGIIGVILAIIVTIYLVFFQRYGGFYRWIISLIAGMFGGAFGGELIAKNLSEDISSNEIPQALRSLIMSDYSLRTALSEGKNGVTKEIIKKLNETMYDDNHYYKTVMIDSIKKALNKSSQSAYILIETEESRRKIVTEIVTKAREYSVEEITENQDLTL